MPEYVAPGVYIEEILSPPDGIAGVATSTAGFVGSSRKGPVNQSVLVTSFAEYEASFGGVEPDLALGLAVRQFFANGGRKAYVVRVEDAARPRGGLASLAGREVSLLCLPDTVEPGALGGALAWCEAHRVFMIVDPPGEPSAEGFPSLPRSPNAAVYYPRILIADPFDPNRTRMVSPSGTVAGVFARTDTARGVWKAPVGTDASLIGVADLERRLDEDEAGTLARQGVNALRVLADVGPVVWGARTLAGTDTSDTEWKFIPVRRLVLFIEESLDRGTQWAVFEPNDEPLWAKVRVAVERFLNGLFRQGAFQGQRPTEAYFVRCDLTTMTQDDVDNGRLLVLVGVAPLKSAEFVLIRIERRVGFSAPGPTPP